MKVLKVIFYTIDLGPETFGHYKALFIRNEYLDIEHPSEFRIIHHKFQSIVE